MANSYDESQTIAVWDVDFAQASAIAKNLNCQTETTYSRLLHNPELTGVVITTPNCLHKEMILQAAAAGKHVFVEKPLCTDVQDAYEIQEAVRKSGIKFYMSDPFVNASTTFIRDFIRSGKLGTLLGVRIRFSSARHLENVRSPKQISLETRQMGGGMMSDTGGHALHILHHLIGLPEKVHACFAYGGDTERQCGSDEYITMLMEYPNEVSAIVEAGMISPKFLNTVEVYGTNGVITDLKIEDHSTGVRYRLNEDADWTVVLADQLPPDPDDHIRYWVRMQAEDLPNNLVGVDPASNHGLSIDDAVALVELREAIYAAAASGTSVPVQTRSR